MQPTTRVDYSPIHNHIDGEKNIADSAIAFMVIVTTVAMGVLGAIAYHERSHFQEHPVISLALSPFAFIAALRLSACFASNLGRIAYRGLE